LVLFIVTASFQFMLPKAAYAFQGGLWVPYMHN
jgi:hypothetical protein